MALFRLLMRVGLVLVIQLTLRLQHRSQMQAVITETQLTLKNKCISTDNAAHTVADTKSVDLTNDSAKILSQLVRIMVRILELQD